MINACFNPKCQKELHYLREGRVVRVVKSEKGREQIEHFWLCGDCSTSHTFEFGLDGAISAIEKPQIGYSTAAKVLVMEARPA
jgi:hypothetical protein